MRANLAKALVGIFAASPVLLLAFSAGPPVLRTGAAADGGLDCSACHRGNAVNDGRGALTITAAAYTPGTRQTITVRLTHPDAMRWGFQLSPRLESDPMQPAGTLLPSDDVQIRCAPAGAQAPCTGGVREFAEQRGTATSPGTGTGRTWTFEWQAPESNVGPVVFYASGNAANNNNNNQGDFIYTTAVTVNPAAAGGPRPAISRGGVADAFNYQASISSHTWFAIVGSNFATGTRTWDSAIQGNNLPTALSGVQVKVNNRPAAVFFISPGQINALAPVDDATGDVNVVVTTPAGDSEPIVVRRAAASPGLYAPFAQNGRLFISAAALNGDLLGKTGVDPRVSRGLRRGETVALFGTGFGATNPQAPADRLFEGTPELVTKPTIRIGDIVLTFPGNGNLVSPGLYQFNVTIPMTVPVGDQPITAEVGGVRTPNTVFVTIE